MWYSVALSYFWRCYNQGGQSSSDRSLSGNEGGMTLQSVYDLCISLCTQLRSRPNKVQTLKRHRSRSLRRKPNVGGNLPRLNLQSIKIKKGAPTVPTNTEWDDLDMDIDDTMDYTLAQDEGKTDKVDEKGESTAQQQSTDRQDEGTDMPKVSTARTKLSTDKVEEGTAEPEPRESTSSAAQTTPTPTPTTFGDDETIAQVLLNMSQAKAVSKEKEKGVEIRNAENAERPRTTSTRSVLTLKPLPKIDPNDKGKKRIEEDEESDTESEEITEAKKKFDQIAHDEEVARKMQEEWEAEEERKRLTEEEATKTALSNEYDFIQARIEADRLLAERVQEAEREQFTVEERAKFLHDTIATQRRILAQQRSEAIRNKPPTKNQFRNQMMTYLKHVGNKKHADLKTKSFDEIKALYEKVKRFDDSFITIGSTEDERKIKEMNEGASDPDKKKKIVKEDVSAKVPAKQDVAEQGTKKRKGGHMKMIARKRKRPQPDVDSDDEHRKCLKIVTFEGTIDSEIMERKSFISKLDKVSSPEGDYLVVYRVNGNFRAFNYLMEVLHIFDRQDLFHLYDLVMKQYSESTPEGIELILWGDLKIMMESSIEVTDQGDFWNDQQDWEIVTWRLYEACGVCILEFKDGTVIHMLVERKYPLSKELLQRMLDFGLEVEVESTAALDLIRVLNSPCFMVKSWLVQDQTVLGKDYSNLLIADSLLKTIWFINAPCYGNEALASPKANVNGKAAYELKGRFLDDLCENTFSGTNGEDAVKHIEYFLKMFDPIDLPNVNHERLRLAVFPISLVGNTRKWTEAKRDLTNTMFEKWLALKFDNHMMMDPFTKKALWDFWRKVDNQEVVTNEGFSDLEKTNNDDEHKIVEIFRIETNLFDYETPLYTKFNEFNYLLKVDTELFTHDIERTKTYEDYKNKWNNEVKEPWSDNGVPYEICDHIFEPFRFKNGKAKWPTCNSNEDGFCNGEDLKEEAPKQKAIYEMSWGDATQRMVEHATTVIFRERRNNTKSDDEEEYVAIKEYQYDDLIRTNKDACHAYQEIFHNMDEGWLVTRAE
ncbi:hypothetical protein Tco_1146477 [Tanacetum coccineum]